MTHAQNAAAQADSSDAQTQPRLHRRSASNPKEFVLTKDALVLAAFEAHRGIAKLDASRLFKRVASGSASPAGKLRAELIPDSSWKRAGKTLGLQASQTTARLDYVLSMAERVWGSEANATEWLNLPHPELQGETPYSFLKTEAGGRAVEALLAALEFGFPV